MKTKKDELKHWRRPELVELLKGRPEEAVLMACKATYSTTPVSSLANCVQIVGGPYCIGCVSNVGT